MISTDLLHEIEDRVMVAYESGTSREELTAFVLSACDAVDVHRDELAAEKAERSGA